MNCFLKTEMERAGAAVLVFAGTGGAEGRAWRGKGGYGRYVPTATCKDESSSSVTVGSDAAAEVEAVIKVDDRFGDDKESRCSRRMRIA